MINAARREQVRALAQEIYDKVEPKRPVTAGEFAMDGDPGVVVARQVDLKNEGERLRVAMTEASARPPFEWLLEITSDIGQSEYFKHYLIRDEDIMLAQRKILTPVDAQEFEVIMKDLKTALDWV
jgi:hypothetical protein